MFAYCGNNPVRYIDALGRDFEEALVTEDDQAEMVPDPDGFAPPNTGQNPQPSSGGSSTSRALTFQSDAKLNDHFSNHNNDFGNAFYTPQHYLDTANYVIQNGQYLDGRNAYIMFYGYKGHANYAFVGLTADHQYITTFHLKDATKIFK